LGRTILNRTMHMAPPGPSALALGLLLLTVCTCTAHASKTAAHASKARPQALHLDASELIVTDGSVSVRAHSPRANPPPARTYVPCYSSRWLVQYKKRGCNALRTRCRERQWMFVAACICLHMLKMVSTDAFRAPGKACARRS